MESPFWEREVSYIGETNTENTNRKFSTESSSLFQIEKEVREQISYGALKHDNPYNMQIDELVGYPGRCENLFCKNDSGKSGRQAS